MNTLPKFILKTAFITISSLAFNHQAISAPLPTGPIDQISGVTFHFTAPDNLAFQKMKTAGIGIGRTDIVWDNIELSKGIYYFNTMDALTDAMVANGIRPMLVLDGSSHLYEPSVTFAVNGQNITRVQAPIHPESILAYSNFAATAAARYKNVIWELWNEPNYSKFWAPGSNASQYAALANSACQAIRKADPNATIIAPGLSAVDIPYLTTVFQSGLLECIDGVSVHPYRTPMPETVVADYNTLKSLINQYASPAKKRKIALLNSEWGYSNLGPDQQADYLMRQKLIDLSAGLASSVWYEWQNDTVNLVFAESNFGLLDSTGYVAKLNYTALYNLNNQIKGLNYLGSLPTSSPNDYIFVFGNSAGKQVSISWTTDTNHSIQLLPSLLANTALLNVQFTVSLVKNYLTTLNLTGTPIVTNLN